MLHQAYPRRLRGGGGRRQRREQSPRPPSTHTDPKGHFSVLETCLGLSSHLNTPSPPRWLPGSHRSPKVGDAVPGHLARWHPCRHPAGARAAPSMKLRLCTPAPPLPLPPTLLSAAASPPQEAACQPRRPSPEGSGPFSGRPAQARAGWGQSSVFLFPQNQQRGSSMGSAGQPWLLTLPSQPPLGRGPQGLRPIPGGAFFYL